jgi:hypothetical protein
MQTKVPENSALSRKLDELARRYGDPRAPVPPRPVVTFTLSQVREIGAIAIKRCEAHDPRYNRRVAGSKDASAFTVEDYEMNFRGLLAECAVAQVLGTDIDRRISALGDGGTTDMLDPKGSSVQVKWTGRRQGVLYFNRVADFKADLAVLCVPTERSDQVEIAGWIPQFEFAAIAQEVNFGYGPRVCVPQDKLHGMDTL